jgi:hypothetical protein
MVLIVILPDFMTMQHYPAHVPASVADTATIIICGVDASAQVIPICTSHLAPQVAIPAWPGNKLNGESHVVLLFPFNAFIVAISSACGISSRPGITYRAFHESIEPYA